MGLEQIRKLKEEALMPKVKVRKPIAKKSAKKIAQEKALKELGTDNEMDRFFAEMRKKMTGKCFFCGGKTQKDDDETYRNSIAHLFPKRKNMFPSIATHSSNWIELCFYGSSCHTNFDNGIITFELLRDSKEWDVIVEKFHELAPLLTDEERSTKFYYNLENLIYKK